MYLFRPYIRCMWMRVITTVLLLPVLLLISATQTEPNADQAIEEHISRLKNEFGYNDADPAVLVNIAKQELCLVRNGVVEKSYKISSAKAGVGSLAGSGKTPLGVHQVSEMFGDGAAIGSIFKARQNTGKIATIIKEPIDVPEDEVTTRVIWLDGLEPGLNKGGNVDSKSRYIYIHGTPEEGLIGQPASHGCVRMYNKDVVELFGMIEVGCLVMFI